MPKFTRETIAEVLGATDIVDVVGSFLELKPSSGGRHLALCPFHSEKTPSFTVNRERQTYYCFGCGKGGDSLSFLQELEGLTFSESLEKLADRAGIRLPAVTSQENDKDRDRSGLLKLGKLAARVFRDKLNDPLRGGEARVYLKSRELKAETVERFGVGYAPDEWQGILDEARKAGFKDGLLESAGLAKRSEQGRFFDFFRNRLMFPIRDVSGNVVAFGGRDLSGKSPAKYINTPENALYKKGRILYGLYESRDALRREKRALLVEGYFDLLRLFDAGIENVVASCGTALTGEQAALIRRYVPEVVVVFDGDAAGIRAALRGVAILTAAGLSVRALTLPEGQDPDDFVRANGAQAFRDLVDNAADFVAFYVRMSEERLVSIEGRTDVARELFTIISGLGDELRRDEYLKLTARELGLGEWAVRSEFQKLSRSHGVRRGPEKAAVSVSRVSHDDVEFVAVLLSCEPLRRRVATAMSSMTLSEGPLGEVVREVVAGAGPDMMQRMESDDAKALYGKATAASALEGEKAEELVTKRMARFERESLEAEAALLLREIKDAEQRKDHERMLELISRKVSIERRIQQVGAA